jgi:hypothetical protein
LLACGFQLRVGDLLLGPGVKELPAPLCGDIIADGAPCLVAKLNFFIQPAELGA